MVNAGFTMLASAKVLLPEKTISAVAGCTPGEVLHSRGAASGSSL
jgi:hypothetical protein